MQQLVFTFEITKYKSQNELVWCVWTNGYLHKSKSRIHDIVQCKHTQKSALSKVRQQQIMHKKLMKINFQVIQNLCTNTNIKPTNFVNWIQFETSSKQISK